MCKGNFPRNIVEFGYCGLMNYRFFEVVAATFSAEYANLEHTCTFTKMVFLVFLVNVFLYPVNEQKMLEGAIYQQEIIKCRTYDSHSMNYHNFSLTSFLTLFVGQIRTYVIVMSFDVCGCRFLQ